MVDSVPRAPLPANLRALYPFASNYISVTGGQLHYIDEGPRDAPVVVCIHGNPTWSFYWRKLVDHLRNQFRVIALDHLGCGLSDKPQTGFRYRLVDHIGNLETLLDSLDVQQASLVVHDWGGAIGMGWATRYPDRVRALVVTNTAAFRSSRIPLSIRLVRVPILGPIAVRGANGFARAAIYRATEKGLSRGAAQGLLFPYNSWANRIGTLRFVEDIPMSPKHPSWSTLTSIETHLDSLAEHPMLILWGEEDWCFTPWFRDEWRRRFPKAQVYSWPKVGHYVMEDAPDQSRQLIQTFLTAPHQPLP